MASKKLLIATVLSMMLCSCSSASEFNDVNQDINPEESLIGTWQRTGGGEFSKITFFDESNYKTDHSNYEGNYFVNDDQLLLKGDLVSDRTYTFSLDDDELTLKNDSSGNESYYKRIDKNDDKRQFKEQVQTNSDPAIADWEIMSYSDFQEDRAWIMGHISGENENTYSISMIGKDGSIIPFIEDGKKTGYLSLEGSFDPFRFTSDYGAIRGENYFVIVRKDGQITYKNEDDNTRLLSCKDGYSMLSVKREDFETSENYIQIIDYSGKVLSEFATEYPIGSGSGYGKGVFGVTRTVDAVDAGFYNKDGKFLSVEEMGMSKGSDWTNNIFSNARGFEYSNECVVGLNADKNVIKLITPDLDMRTLNVKMPESVHLFAVGDIRDEVILGKAKSDDFDGIIPVSINAITGEVILPEGRYFSDCTKVLGSNGYTLSENGTIAVEVQGKDGKKYFNNLNSELEPVGDPIETMLVSSNSGISVTYKDNMFTIYNDINNPLFSTNQYDAVFRYSDGAFRAFGSDISDGFIYNSKDEGYSGLQALTSSQIDNPIHFDQVTYLNIDGDKLFESIN